MATPDPREIEAILRSETSALRDKIVRNVGDFTVALFGISGSPQERLKLAGTGTLVMVEGKHFILTALHVWEEILRHADRIGITVKENTVHRTVIDRREVTAFGLLRPREWNEWGPDVVLLSVPAEDVGRISAYRCFWNLGARIEINAEVLEVRILMGTPAALGTITEAYADLEIHGWFLGPETRQVHGELDYLDYEIELSFPVPRNFAGVSGGGVWQVYMYWTPTGEAIDWKMSLHGVAFYQLPIIAERRPIRCHGPETIRRVVGFVGSQRE